MRKITTSLVTLGAIGLLSASMLATACDKQADAMHKTAAPAKAASNAHQVAIAPVANNVNAGQLVASAPYARAVAPGQPNSAVFLQVQNKDSKAHALVKATSAVAGAVELHNHVNEGGVMKMRKVEKIDLPAGKAVDLKPGSFHIMLIGLKKPLKVGETVAVTLSFEDGTTLDINAPVKEVTAPAH